MKKKLVSLLAMALVASMAFSGCAAPQQAETDQDGGYVVETLRLAADGDWGGPNPYLHSTRGPGTQKMTLVFDSLLTAGPEGLIPWLAESYTVDDLTYTFTIHKDALWHDGQPVTTADIAFTIDYYREFMPAQDVSYTLGTGENFAIDSYEIVDDYTIKIKAAKKLASNERNIGSFPILPKHIWEKVEDPYTYNEPDAFIGCGMYKSTAYDAATGSYEFEAFDQYYGHQQAARYVRFIPTSDELLAFENNEIDLADVSPDLIDKYKQDPSIKMIEKYDDFGYKLLINFDKVPELKDLEVRKALYKALDRQAMVDSVFRGAGHVASAGHVPQTSMFYTDEVEKYDYEPEEAKSVLEPLNLSVRLCCEESGDAANIAQMVKLNLEAAGVKVTVDAYDTATRDAKVFDGDYELAINSHGGWNMTPDYMQTLYSDVAKGKSKSPLAATSYGYTSEALTELAEAEAVETDFDKRVEKFQELQVQASKEIPILPLCTQVTTSMYHPEVYDCWRKEFDFQQFNLCRISFVVSLDD